MGKPLIDEYFELKEARPRLKIVTSAHAPNLFRRTLAFVVDALFIALVSLLMLPFGTIFEQLEFYAPVPFIIFSILYFGYCDSHFLRGQTLGKKLLKIEVVNADNVAPSFGAALIRAFLTVIVFTSVFTDFTPFSKLFTLNYFANIFGVMSVFVLFIGSFVFPLVHEQKRTLQDVLTGTLVVPAGNVYVGRLVRFTRSSALWSLSIWALLFAIVSYSAFSQTIMQTELSHLDEIFKRELGNDYVSVIYVSSSEQINKTLSAHVFVSSEIFEQEKLQKSYAMHVLNTLKRINVNPEVDSFSVQLHSYRLLGLLPIKRTVSFTK